MNLLVKSINEEFTMVISTSENSLEKVVETIHANLKGFDVKCLIKLHDIFMSSKGGSQEENVMKNIFQVVVHIYESQMDIGEEHDIQCHLLVGECYEYLLNVLKKSKAHDKDLCLKAIDVLIAMTKKQSQSFNIIFKFVSNALLDIITCSQLNISERKEFMKALNFVLENTDRKLRYKIRDELKIENLSKLLYTCGDYETQANLIETIFRYTSMEERKSLSRKWLNDSNEIITSFLSIKDFEPDCRKFLIKFNNSLRDGTLVFSLPCLTAAIGKCELQKPEDPNCEEFWIDFNLGSSSVSVVCSQESLYAQSIYGSEITPGFWETLNVECHSVSKVTLQNATLFPAPGRMKEDAFEICMKLLQPCHILFSFPSNFEGNMIVITFSMRYLRKIKMLIERLFPKNNFFNVRKHPPTMDKRKKSSVAHLSEGSIISINSGESVNEYAFNCKPVGRPTSANDSGVHSSKDSVRRSVSCSKRPKDCQLEEKKFNQLSRSCIKSPYKPLEIVISPSGNKTGLSGMQYSEQSQLRTPESYTLSTTEAEGDTSGKSIGSKDTGIGTLNASLPYSLSSQEQNKTEKDISKYTTEQKQSSIVSHQETSGTREKENDASHQKIPIPDTTNNSKSESTVCSDVINKRVLRSQKRLTVKGDVNDETQETTFCPEMGKNQAKENYTSSTKISQRVNLEEKPQQTEPHITGERLTKMRENLQKAEKGKSFSSNSKQNKNSFSDSSDTESGSTWKKFVRSGPKNKLTSTNKEMTNKPSINSRIEDIKSKKNQVDKNVQERSNIPEQNKFRKSDELENEIGKKNYAQSRGENKILSMRKKLFNSSDNKLMVPIGQSLDVNDIAVCEPLQPNQPKNINMSARKTLDPTISILNNWMSGTDSELSWLYGKKTNELPHRENTRRSYQGNRNPGRKLGGKLNHSVKSFIDQSIDEDAKRNRNNTSTKSMGDNLKTRKGLRVNQDEISDSSSDEYYKKKGRPKKGKQKSSTDRKRAFKGKREQDKRNTIATSRKRSSFTNSPPQHDFVATESSSRNENVKGNITNGQGETLSEKTTSSALKANSISESMAPIKEKEVISNVKNYSPNEVKNNALIAENNLNPKNMGKSPADLGAHELPCKDKVLANESTNLESLTKSSKKQNFDHHLMGFQTSPHLQGSNKYLPKNLPPETVGKILTERIIINDQNHSLGIELKGQTTAKNEEASSDCQKNICYKRMENRLSMRKTTVDSSHDNVTQSRTGKKGYQANEPKLSPNLESHSQRMHKSMQDGLLMRESGEYSTHGNVTQGKTEKKICETNESKISPNLESHSQTMNDNIEDRLLMRDSALNSTRDNISHGRTRKRGSETNKSKISPNLESHSQTVNKSIEDRLLMRESALHSTHDNISHGRTRKRGSEINKSKISPNLESHLQTVNKSIEDQLLMRESALNSTHDNILHGRTRKRGCDTNESNISPNLEIKLQSSKSEMSSSDDEDESWIPPSLVEKKNTSLPIFKKSLPGAKGILNSKNITTKRGSYFNTPIVEERKQMKYSSIKDSLDACGYLGNTNYFSSNASMLKSQGSKRGNQSDMNQKLAGLTSTAPSMPTTKLKDWEEKLHNLFAQKEVPSTTPEKLISESQEEIELDKLISELDSTSKIIKKSTKDYQDNYSMQAVGKSTLNTASTDLVIHSGPEKDNSKIIPRKRSVNDSAQCKKRRFTSEDAKLEKQNSKRKSYPHLPKDTTREDSFPNYGSNCSVDPILDIGRTIQQLFKRHNTIKTESLNDIRNRLLNLTAQASEDLRLEFIREGRYFGDIDGQIKNLHDSLEKENSLIKRFDKCYKYLHNTSLMKSQNDQNIKESLDKIRNISEENAIRFSEQNDISIDEKYKEILTSKVEILKEKFIKQEQKKEMVKNLQYVKSLILR